MIIDVDSEVFRSFAYFSGILGLKLLGAMFVLTAIQRARKNVFANPEDISLFNKMFANTEDLKDKKKHKPNFDDPDVERVRRAHLNDLENIIPFWCIGFLYCFTNPAAATANTLFKVFTVARIVHTIVYAVYPVPQPTRFIAFFVAYVINIYMAEQIVCHFA